MEESELQQEEAPAEDQMQDDQGQAQSGAEAEAQPEQKKRGQSDPFKIIVSDMSQYTNAAQVRIK